MPALRRRVGPAPRPRARRDTGAEGGRHPTPQRSRANIQQLNTVRKQLSQIKGGGLARACSAGQLITLIISDVLGDPLDVIASGPTVQDTTTARDAIEVLQRFPLEDREVAGAVLSYLEDRASADPLPAPQAERRSLNYIIGNNALAVDAAGREAERRGYAPATIAARELEGEADAIGRHLAHMAQHMRQCPGPDCLVTGGEPTVTLIDPARRGLGGRNQQLALAALHELTTASQAAQPSSPVSPLEGIAILAGGTDGEDGPTDAAGAVIDRQIAQASDQRSLDIEDYLRRNDAYHFFGQLDGLLQTGPTHTNVCDLRVVVVDRVEHSG